MFALMACAALGGEASGWLPFSEEVFARAAREDKLVLLEVGAMWCHWCHVMEQQTWSDPAVQQRLRDSFLTISVDQDARPDLSQRYEDWGWPATILLRPDGTELAKLRGYQPPERMIAILDAFIADPTPGPSAISERIPEEVGTALSPEQFHALKSRWDAVWDEEHGGWGRITKALDRSSIELSFLLGTETDIERALRTVTQQRKLSDPIWGGMYQYSDSGIWDRPHYEKLAPVQADNLRAAALAYAKRRDPVDRSVALSIVSYLEAFLWDEGYAPSQDADLVPGEHAADYFALDDAGRRARGIPRVDPNRYARDNGLLTAALADASGWLGEQTLLALAIRTAEWSMASCAVAGGGYRCADEGPLWLTDTLAMGEAFSALYTATADIRWRMRAIDAARAIEARFHAENGYRTAQGNTDIPGLPPVSHREENARVVRLASQLAWADADAADEMTAIARHAMALCAGLADDGPSAPVLLADLALGRAPLHIVVVGPEHDARTRALYDAARALPVVFRWLERRDTPGDLQPVDVPTAFVCGDGYCSPPITDPAALSRSGIQRSPSAR